MPQSKTKAQNLAKRIGCIYAEASECRRALEEHIEPSPQGTGRPYKQAALDLLKMAMNALEEAAGYVEDIR